MDGSTPTSQGWESFDKTKQKQKQGIRKYIIKTFLRLSTYGQNEVSALQLIFHSGHKQNTLDKIKKQLPESS